MEIAGKLQEEYIRFMFSLLLEGFLDGDFLGVQRMQDLSRTPGFVVKVVSLYFEVVEKYVKHLTISLSQQVVDFNTLGIDIDQFKGCSSAVGAKRVNDALVDLRNAGKEKNLGRCMKCVQLAEWEYFLLKNKLETLFRMEKEIVAAGDEIPIIY